MHMYDKCLRSDVNCKKKKMIKYLHVFNKGYSNINQYVSALYLMVNQCCKKDV